MPLQKERLQWQTHGLQRQPASLQLQKGFMRLQIEQMQLHYERLQLQTKGLQQAFLQKPWENVRCQWEMLPCRWKTLFRRDTFKFCALVADFDFRRVNDLVRRNGNFFIERLALAVLVEMPFGMINARFEIRG